MKSKMLLVLLLLVFLFNFGHAGEINFGGMVQTWFSVAEEGDGSGNDYGFTFRRIRFKPYGKISEKLSWLVQVGWDSNSPDLLDAYLEFTLSKALAIRVGQYPVPGSISGNLTPSSKLDFVERPMVTQRWNGYNSLSGYRALGIQFHGRLVGDKLYYALMLANPKALSPFTPRIKSSQYENAENGLQVWARLEATLLKGLTIGTFWGSTREEKTGIDKETYGAHLAFLTNGIKLKVEYLYGDSGVPGTKTKYSGTYAVIGYQFGKFEPILRFDDFIPNNDMEDEVGVLEYTNYTLGLNYYYNPRIKVQVNVVIRDERMAQGLFEITNNLFYICLQYSF